MAYNQHGHGYYRQYSDSQQNQQNHPHPHPPPPPPPPPATRWTVSSDLPRHDHDHVRRTPSFETGDEAPLQQQSYGSSRRNRPYRTASSELFIGTSHPPAHNTNGQLSAVGALQYHESPMSAVPPTPSTYNPQEYARPDPGSTLPPQNTYINRVNSQSTHASPDLAHQPYIPAAYSSAPAYNHAAPATTPASAYYNATPAYQTSPRPGQPPPVPPRPHEGGQAQAHWRTSSSSPGSQYTSHFSDYGYRASASLPFVPSTPPHASYPTTYTPPAPPPAPRPVYAESYAHSDSPALVQYDNTPQPHVPMPSFPAPNSSGRELPPLPNYADATDYAIPPSRLRQSSSPGRSPLASAPSTPGPPPPQHSPQRQNTLGRHPQARPLPGPPSESYSSAERSSQPELDDDDLEPQISYDEIMREVEDALMDRQPSNARRPQRSYEQQPDYRTALPDEQSASPLFGGSHDGLVPDIAPSHTNNSGTGSTAIDVNYGAYSDESDAEAAAGLAAMQMAEEQDAADAARRFSGLTAVPSTHASQRSLHRTRPDNGDSSDSDAPYDMDRYGGGGSFPSGLNYHYGTQPGDGADQDHAGDKPRASFSPSERRGQGGDDYFMPADDEIHPFPAFAARTDTGGTGGLSEPDQISRRLSFDDGDESTLMDSEGHLSNSQSPMVETPPRILQYPSRMPSRPLPRLPGPSVSETFQRRPVDQYGQPVYPQAPDEYEQGYTSSGTPVQKANSVGSYTSTPQIVPPGRSVTDAAELRRRQPPLKGIRTSVDYANSPDTATTSKLADLDLPAIPSGKRRKFIPSKLSTAEFKKCTEPWALSSIVTWMKEMTDGEADLKESAIVEAIVSLFTNKVPTMNTADAEVLSANVVHAMFESGTLFKDEEWVKFGPTETSGVLFQLTGTGCYSPKVHDLPLHGRCYSHHCMRTLKKINLQTHGIPPQRKLEDWTTFYKLKKEDIENKHKKEVERQNILHEIVTSEDYYMEQLDVLRLLYRDNLAKSSQQIISPKRIDAFLRDVFGRVDPVKQVNEDHLLAQLKYRQNEQGPWIIGFSDIFREWIRKSKAAYIDYASNYPSAELKVRREAERNVLFRQFLDQMRDNERSRRLGWDTYLKAPITRLQRYTLLLSTVYKNMLNESEEKNNLATAIEEIKTVTMECDTRVAEMSKRADLSDLSSKLQLRPEMRKVQLNLNHLGRQLIYQGDLQRKGSNKISWVEIRAILFDHYLVLAKPVRQRDAAGGLKSEIFDVSKMPIPMDLLVLETTNDDPVVKSSVKGITSVTTVATRVQSPQDARGGRTGSVVTTGSGPGTLTHTTSNNSVLTNGTNNSAKTMIPSTVLEGSSDKVMFPFMIRHLGHSESYILYAPTLQARTEWCDKIIEAKTRHAQSLFAQNAEPFRLRVMADTAFAVDAFSSQPRQVVIKGTPLDRAIEEAEKSFRGKPRATPVCRAQVNCATAFNQPFGKYKIAVGTDFGVFISDYDNPRGWTRAIAATRVTQIAVLEEFSVCLIIADKSLIAYHLETVCPPNEATSSNSDSARRAPQKLSGNKDVGYFSCGRMKDRTLVFYKKRDGINSTFKVLEPVYQRSSTASRNRFGLRKGTTEFFRDFDEFYIPSESYAINLFHSSLAIATAKGIEVLTLDKKVPFSIPDLKPPEVSSIAQRIREQKPLGMFRLTDTEFLLVFEEVGIYVDKHGDVSRAVVMEFVGRAKQAALHGGMYLVLVDASGGFLEVRNAVNGRLRQVVSGRDVRLLDDGVGGSLNGTVKVALQHPEAERAQVVVELIVNEGLRE